MDDLDIPELKRDQLGKGVCGKYFVRTGKGKGSNLVLLNDKAAEAIFTGKAVNEVLLRLNALKKKACITARSSWTSRKRAVVVVD